VVTAKMEGDGGRRKEERKERKKKERKKKERQRLRIFNPRYLPLYWFVVLAYR
jgi:hypothetical protein